jgi:uncharacterized membrane-anchored protein YhcB (DUF1043 family)
VDIQQLLPYAPWAAAVVALAAGFLLGRAGQGPKRRRELEGELSVLRGLEEEGRSTREGLERRLEEAQVEADAYKQKVVDHFYGTSDELRALTLQYRSVFDHLADGARELCPDEIGQLEGEFGVPALGAGEELELDSEKGPLGESEPEPAAEPNAGSAPGPERAAS